MEEPTGTSGRNQYRTSAGYQMDERRLVLRGGKLDGRSWTGMFDVGKRVFCGDGAWSTDQIYLVTAEVSTDGEGNEANVAIPAFA